MTQNDKHETPPAGGSEGAGPQETAGSEEAQIQSLRKERDELLDRLLRKQAEFENFRRRAEKERSEYIQFASSELMKELLGALDSFELALRNAKSGDQNTIRGVELIHKQLLDTMGRFGLKAIDAMGQKFDPNFHQAVATQASDEVEENTVLEEMRTGYLLNGRLRRPAMVSVSVKA